MTFDFQRIWESKRAYRRKLAALPIAEKLRMLDALCERALVLRPKSGVITEAPGKHRPRKKA